jgi:hypothetical protein
MSKKSTLMDLADPSSGVEGKDILDRMGVSPSKPNEGQQEKWKRNPKDFLSKSEYSLLLNNFSNGNYKEYSDEMLLTILRRMEASELERILSPPVSHPHWPRLRMVQIIKESLNLSLNRSGATDQQLQKISKILRIDSKFLTKASRKELVSEIKRRL